MEFRAKIVKWTEIEKWCEEINMKMSVSFQPDVIIGMSRGGLVPARIVADMNLIKDLFAVKTEHWGLTATVDGEAVMKYGLNVSVEGRNVLVVDDITDTGQSMKLAYDYAMTLKAKSVKTATMLHIAHSKFIPDFYGEEVSEDKWTWFIFPWNIYEDLTNLIGKLKISDAGQSRINELLISSYDLSVEDSLLKKVIDQMVRLGKLKETNGTFSVT
ncbi:MAG: phosphoribosyltransferase [Candidatus Thermoplasmatota archaeon]|jgi:hypoxanthine phosphoribosyltransferase|nr:phosphoribosyltransferase [Candidatus Thermoplasmatota archaeon]